MEIKSSNNFIVIYIISCLEMDIKSVYELLNVYHFV